MRSALALSSVAALASVVAAQTGYGRFPCTVVNNDGSYSPNQQLCEPGYITAPGTGAGNDAGVQGDGVTPTNSVCTMETESGAYFCGIAGAACSSASNCDNGHCVDGTCQGGFEQSCSGDDTNCLGYLYCTNGDYSVTDADTCGGLNSYCQDPDAADLSISEGEAQAVFAQFCSSGYCNGGTASCDVKRTLGGDCSLDPAYQCATGYTCDTASYTCQLAAVAPSQAARARRSLHRRNLCPPSQQACAVEGFGKTSYECVDVLSNLEQCGACANQGGVDCTALPFVESVGCVAGTCEIWSCVEGAAWDAQSQSCVAN
ncbi:hypothetical protein JCM10213_002652 [Rhodosporidiobolus nylandii]